MMECDLMLELYPAIAPYNTATLKVSDLHTLYFEQAGNPSGKPIIFLHGGSEAEFIIVPDAGHSLTELGIGSALIEARSLCRPLAC